MPVKIDDWEVVLGSVFILLKTIPCAYFSSAHLFCKFVVYLIQNVTTSNKIDDFNKLVDFVGNIIKATTEPEDQAGVDEVFNITHTIGDALKIISDDSQK